MLTDYDFKKPQTDLTADQPTVAGPSRMKQYEFFDYPGLYTDKDAGSALARTRIETEEAEYHTVSGQGMVPSFRAGETFTLEHHTIRDEEGKEYALLSVQHHAVETSYARADAVRRITRIALSHCRPRPCSGAAQHAGSGHARAADPRQSWVRKARRSTPTNTAG